MWSGVAVTEGRYLSRPGMTRALSGALWPSLVKICTSRSLQSYSPRPHWLLLASALFTTPSRGYASNVKIRSYLQYVKRKLGSPSKPPYSHVCQVGDPVLRGQAAAVTPEEVGSAEVQQVIRTLVKVMRQMECVGLSAPQIGVPLRILAMEYPERMLVESSEASRRARGLEAFPLCVFINPELRVLDGRTALFQEACESISGFSASVPRYLSVEVSGKGPKMGLKATTASVTACVKCTDRKNSWQHFYFEEL